MRRKRSLYVDCGVVVLLIVLLTAVNHGYIRRHAFVGASDAVAAAPKPAPSAAPALKTRAGYGNPAPPAEPASKAAPMAPVSFRPLNFALLRGGFTSVDEFFERVNEDPILHSFYGDCSDRNASMHPLNSDVMVFTAFRRGNQIKWAKRPLLVRKGEYVMTYCGKTVLARCGNLVSMAAMQPSEDIPPGLLETPVDAIQPPISYGSNPVAELVVPAGVTPAPAAVTPIAAHHGRSFFFIPPFYVPSGHGHNPGPPATVTPPPPSTPPASNPPPSTPPPATPPPGTPPPSGPPSPPSTPPPSGPPSTPPSGPPGPPTHVSGDEFTEHGASFTLLFGLLVIALLKLLTR